MSSEVKECPVCKFSNYYLMTECEQCEAPLQSLTASIDNDNKYRLSARAIPEFRFNVNEELKDALDKADEWRQMAIKEPQIIEDKEEVIEDTTNTDPNAIVMKNYAVKTSASKGVGYSGSVGELKTVLGKIDEAAAKAKNQDKDIIDVLQAVYTAIHIVLEKDGHITELADSLSNSKGLKFIFNILLRNDSIADITTRGELYRLLFKLINLICSQLYTTAFLLARMNVEEEDRNDDPHTCETLLVSLSAAASMYLKVSAAADGSSAAKVKSVVISDSLATEKDVLDMVTVISQTHSNLAHSKDRCSRLGLVPHKSSLLFKSESTTLSSSSSSSSSSTSSSLASSTINKDLDKLYVTTLREKCFDICDIVNTCSHRFVTDKKSIETVHASQRIVREVPSLLKDLPCNFSSSIVVRADEAHINVMKALVIGPEGTPYQNGCFEFDIILPSQYPNVPPKVLLCTTGNGTVRFNPNLYNEGKVCLSLLGTWSGPGWDPKISTLLQVLISIQSLILVPDPYYNEPGYANQEGTSSGDKSSRDYNANIMDKTVKFAIIEQLRSPSPIFADIIRTHFELKADSVRAQLEEWAEQIPQYNIKKMIAEFDALVPPKPQEKSQSISISSSSSSSRIVDDSSTDNNIAGMKFLTTSSPKRTVDEICGEEIENKQSRTSF